MPIRSSPPQHHRREELDGAGHVVLVDRRTPLFFPAARGQKQVPDLGVHHAHLERRHEARLPGPQAILPTDVVDEAAGLHQTARHVPLQAPRVGQRLVPGGRTISQDQSAESQHQASGQAGAQEGRAAQLGPSPVEPHRRLMDGLGQGEEGRRTRRLRSRHRHLGQAAIPFRVRERQQLRSSGVGEGVRAGEEAGQPVHSISVAGPDRGRVDEAARDLIHPRIVG
jgi:hypothetical protein